MKTYSLIDVNPEQGDVTFETGLSYRMAKESISHYEDRYVEADKLWYKERIDTDKGLDAVVSVLRYVEIMLKNKFKTI